MSHRKLKVWSWTLLTIIVFGTLFLNRLKDYVEAQEPPNIVVEAQWQADSVPIPTPIEAMAVDTINDALALDKYINNMDSVNVQNCIVQLSPVSKSQKIKASEIESVVCGYSLEQLQELIAATTWIRIDYSGANRTGNQLVQTTSHTGGCSDSSYLLPDYATLGWANIPSSVESNVLKGCNRTISYDLSWYGGPQLISTPLSLTMNAMDNETQSSWTGK
jgi:hypothetical protein